MGTYETKQTVTGAILWNIRQAAEALGLSRHTLYAWVSQKRIAHVKAGRKVMFDPRDLQAWIQERKVQPRSSERQ
jgi:excisionase family DNA binding protein